MKLHKAFADGSSTNIKFSKYQLSKILQLEGFLLLSLIFPAFEIGEKIVKRRSTAIAKDAVKHAAK